MAKKSQRKVTPKRTPHSVIVLFLLFFPPLAWFFMMIDKTYHHWLIKVLFISGIISLSLLSFFYLTVGIELIDLYTILGLENLAKNTLITASMWTGAIFAVLQIIVAIYSHHYLKHHGKLQKSQLVIISILLISSLAVALIPPLMMLQALTTLISSV